MGYFAHVPFAARPPLWAFSHLPPNPMTLL